MHARTCLVALALACASAHAAPVITVTDSFNENEVAEIIEIILHNFGSVQSTTTSTSNEPQRPDYTYANTGPGDPVAEVFLTEARARAAARSAAGHPPQLTDCITDAPTPSIMTWPQLLSAVSEHECTVTIGQVSVDALMKEKTIAPLLVDAFGWLVDDHFIGVDSLTMKFECGACGFYCMASDDLMFGIN